MNNKLKNICIGENLQVRNILFIIIIIITIIKY